MYILTGNGKSVIDSHFVERFCLVEETDAVLIIASYSADRSVTIGKYADKMEASAAFNDLFNGLVGNSDGYGFIMADSTLFHGAKRKRDSRTVRKGGS